MQPQVRIDDASGFVGRVDLADVRLRLVIEGESFEFHGEREMLDRDCRRYSRLTADGWLVLRFSWNQVMTRPAWVREVIAAAVQTWSGRVMCGRRRRLTTRSAPCRCAGCSARPRRHRVVDWWDSTVGRACGEVSGGGAQCRRSSG